MAFSHNLGWKPTWPSVGPSGSIWGALGRCRVQVNTRVWGGPTLPARDNEGVQCVGRADHVDPSSLMSCRPTRETMMVSTATRSMLARSRAMVSAFMGRPGCRFSPPPFPAYRQPGNCHAFAGVRPVRRLRRRWLFWHKFGTPCVTNSANQCGLEQSQMTLKSLLF